MLLATGILIGPVTHWVNAARFSEITRGFGTLALILILFAAGLELDLRNALRQVSSGLVLAFICYGLTFVGITYFCIYALHLQRLPAMLVASALACISGSIVLPVLEQLELRPEVKTTLIVEASFGDGVGALGVSVLLDLAAGGRSMMSGPLPNMLEKIGMAPGSRQALAGGVAALILFKFLLALAVAIAAGFAWTRLLPLISDQQFWQVLTFAAVLLVYAGTHALGASELFAVMAFGATLANLPDPRNPKTEFGFRILPPDPSKQIHSFHSELAFLVRSFFFVLLGVLVEFGGLRRQAVAALGILGVLFLARFLAVELSRIVWRGTTHAEREVAILLIPRGLITAVLALEVVQAIPAELSFLTPLTFAVILITNVLVLMASIRANRLRTKNLIPRIPPSESPARPDPLSQ